MKVWMPDDCITALKQCAKIRGLNLNQVVHGCLGSPTNVWTGKKNFVNINLPYELIAHRFSPDGVAPYIHVDLNKYTDYPTRIVMNTIDQWPRMTDKRHRSKMKVMFSDSHPALWNIQAAIRTKNFTECLIRFGAFDFRPYLKPAKMEVMEVINNHTKEELARKLIARLEPSVILSVLGP